MKIIFEALKWLAWFILSFVIASIILYSLTGANDNINPTNLVALWIVLFIPFLVIKMRKIRKYIATNDK